MQYFFKKHLLYTTPLDECFYFIIVSGFILFILCNYIQPATFNTSREKKSSIYFKDFTGFRFFLFSLKVPVYLVRYAVTQSICCTINFGQFWKFQYHLEHFPRHTGFLSFGGPSNYLYLFRNHRKTFSWPGKVRHPTSKLLEYWFGSNIKIAFRTLLCRFLLLGRHLLFRSS